VLRTPVRCVQSSERISRRSPISPAAESYGVYNERLVSMKNLPLIIDLFQEIFPFAAESLPSLLLLCSPKLIFLPHSFGLPE